MSIQEPGTTPEAPDALRSRCRPNPELRPRKSPETAPEPPTMSDKPDVAPPEPPSQPQ